MKKTKAKERLIEGYIKSLEQGKIPWKRPWIGPMNPVSNTKYRGINFLTLALEAEEKGYKDPRWITFKQAQKNDWHIKAGSKGVPIEFYSLYLVPEKRTVGYAEATQLLEKNLFTKNDIRSIVQTYYVFNASQVEGIEEFQNESLPQKEATKDFTVLSLANEMNLEVEVKGSQAYYSPSDDTVRMPCVETFETYEAYNQSLLHEICHATGHSSRMNRDLTNKFGSEGYAKEELKAEIASLFLVNEYGFEFDPLIENSQAYIQSWMNILKNEPEELFTAIRDAEKIEKYCLEKLPVEKALEIEKNMELYQYRVNHFFLNIGGEGNDLTIQREKILNNEPIELRWNANKETIELDLIKSCAVHRQNGEIKRELHIGNMENFTKFLETEGLQMLQAIFPEFDGVFYSRCEQLDEGLEMER